MDEVMDQSHVAFEEDGVDMSAFEELRKVSCNNSCTRFGFALRCLLVLVLMKELLQTKRYLCERPNLFPRLCLTSVALRLVAHSTLTRWETNFSCCMRLDLGFSKLGGADPSLTHFYCFEPVNSALALALASIRQESRSSHEKKHDLSMA